MSARSMTEPLGRIDAWLGAPAPAARLRTFRVLTGMFALTYVLVRLTRFVDLVDGRPSAFEPVGVLAPLEEPLAGWIVTTIIVTVFVTGLAYTLGFAFRIAGPTFAVALLLITTYRSSWGQLLHFENLMVLHVGIVAFSPAGRGGDRSGESSPRFGWPLRLAAVVTATTYVLAGIAKLRGGGFEWIFGDTLQNHVAYTAARLDVLGAESSPVAGLLVDQGWLFVVFAAATVAIELAAPIVFVTAALRVTWIVAAWLMHAMIAASMFVVFPYPLFGLAFAPLLPLERIGPALGLRSVDPDRTSRVEPLCEALVR